MSNYLSTIIFIVFISAHFSKIVQVGAAEDEPTKEGMPQTETGGSSTDSPKYPPLILYNQFYCPAEDKDREILQRFPTKRRNILSTLLPRTFNNDQQKLCKYEFEPVLERSRDSNGNELINRKNNNMLVYIFAFQIWKYSLSPLDYIKHLKKVITQTNSIPQLRVNYAPIYNICYDNSIAKVAFTRHKITAQPQNQPFNITDEFSTKPYDFENDYFLKIDRAFRAYNDNPNNPHKMIKQRLVPATDLFPSYRKAAMHFINVAPLWDKLSLLMKLIIFGIRKADFHIKRKFQQENHMLRISNSSAVHELIIYTKIIYSALSLQEQEANELTIPYAWVKFVHYRAAKLGVLIYIHNTPQHPPRDKNIYCDAENRFDCKFFEWIGGVDRNIENLEYAYCCKASPLIISRYFLTPFEIVGELNIDRVANGDITISVPPVTPNISPLAQQSNIPSTETSSARQNIFVANAPIRITPNSANSQAPQQMNAGSSEISVARRPTSNLYPPIRINLNSYNSQTPQPTILTTSNTYPVPRQNISNPYPPISVKFNSAESRSAQPMTNEAKTTEKVDTSDTSMQLEGNIDTSDLLFQQPEPEPEDLWTKKRYTSKRARLDSDESSDEE